MDELMGVLSAGADELYTEVIKKALEYRILILNEEITGSAIENYAFRIMMWNIEDKGKAVEARTPIKILINSVGGDVYSGFGLIDAIKTSTTPVYSIGTGIVASMAYQIYIGCAKRYAFQNTILLQHDGALSISNSTSKARDTMDFINAMEARTKQYVLENSKMTEEMYDKKYDTEFYFFADEGKELGVVDGIIGVDVSLDDIF